MKRSEKQSTPRSMRLGILFLILVLFLVISSLGLKLFVIIKQSNFDGVNRYNLAVIHNKSSMEVFSFLPDARAISVMRVIGDRNASISQLLYIPIDAWINFAPEKDINTVLWQLIYRFDENNTKNFTIIDALRLFLFSKTISGNSISQTKIFLKNDNSSKISSFSVDNAVYKEGVTFAIINASEEAGAAGRLAKLITNIGGDVISVTTSTQARSKSNIVYFNKKNYTVSKLQKLLGFSVENKSGSGIADIIVTLGKDSLKLNIF